MNAPMFPHFRRSARAMAAALAFAALVPATPAFALDNFKLALARYTPAGAPDVAFGAGGMVVTEIAASASEEAKAAKLDAAGRVVVAGSALVAGSSRFAVARYLANGALDGGFGAGGVVTTDFPASASEAANAVAIDAAGRIVAAGYGTVGAGTRIAVARYLANGALDGTFGAGGVALVDIPASPNETAYAVSLDDAGRIVVAGSAVIGGRYWFALARRLANGAPDVTFDGDGVVLTDAAPGGTGGQIRALAIDSPTDMILVAGESGVPAAGGLQITLARYLPTGAVDLGFDGDGRRHLDLAGSMLDRAFAVAITPDHKIVTAGMAMINGGNRIALTRCFWNGGMDPAFAGGVVITNLPASSSEWASAMQIAPDGRIVVAGGAVFMGASRFLAGRYHVNGTLDAAFGGGMVTTDFAGSGLEQGNAVVLDALGRVIVVGRR